MSGRQNAHARAARDTLAELLGPYGFDVSLETGGKHNRVVCDGPIRATYSVSKGTHVDRAIATTWARQFAQGVIRRLQEGRAA